MITVRISRVRRGAEDIPFPAHATPHSAGMDLCAAIEGEVSIPPTGRMLIPTSIAIELPIGYEAQVRPRSGLALRHGVTVLNAPGTIDADYRGEVQVILVNHGDVPFTVRRGDRIAQMIVARHERVEWEVAAELAPSARGSGGFGHSGVAVDPAAGRSDA